MKKIKATFKGQDGSCGYRTGKKYSIKVEHTMGGRGFIVINSLSGEGGFCEYNSIIAFLTNWDKIEITN